MEELRREIRGFRHGLLPSILVQGTRESSGTCTTSSSRAAFGKRRGRTGYHIEMVKQPGPSCRGVLAGLPHTTYRLPDRAPQQEGPGINLFFGMKHWLFSSDMYRTKSDAKEGRLGHMASY